MFCKTVSGVDLYATSKVDIHCFGTTWKCHWPTRETLLAGSLCRSVRKKTNTEKAGVI